MCIQREPKPPSQPLKRPYFTFARASDSWIPQLRKSRGKTQPLHLADQKKSPPSPTCEWTQVSWWVIGSIISSVTVSSANSERLIRPGGGWTGEQPQHPPAVPFLPRQSNPFSCLSFPNKQGRPTQRCLPHQDFERKRCHYCAVSEHPFRLSLVWKTTLFPFSCQKHQMKGKNHGEKNLAHVFHYMAWIVCVTQMGYVYVQQRRLELASGRSYEMCF